MYKRMIWARRIRRVLTELTTGYQNEKDTPLKVVDATFLLKEALEELEGSVVRKGGEQPNEMVD